MIYKKDNELIYEYDNEKVVIEGWGPDAFRVRATRNKDFTDHNWALSEAVPQTTPEVVVKKDENSGGAGMFNMYKSQDNSDYHITNGKITASINNEGVITYKNANGKILLQEQWQRLKDVPSKSLNRNGREFKAIEGENYHLAVRFVPNDGEKLFGMGQYQMKYMDMKGCSLELADRNSQASVPFVLSSEGYGFLWNNPAIGRVTFAKNETEWIAESSKQIDYWIVAGDTPAEIEQKYMSVVGKAPMMPEYGMGFWQCKLRYRTQEELLTVARKHKALGLPMDVIVADFFHWTQQGEYKFDPEAWPDVKGMCDELDKMGIKLMVSVWPTVDRRSENWDEMMEKGMLVRTERGVRVTMQMFGQETFMDPTNPATRKFVWEKCKKNYFDNGVRLFWLDEAEPEYTVYDYDNYRYYLGTDKEVGNIYPLMYAKGFFEGMKEAGMENPMNLLRCAWAGSAKYGALVWSGDIDSTWECFGRQIRAGLSMAIAGIPWWTTDIGGFHGAFTDDKDFRQLLIRWFEWGAFCPVMRLHGNRNPAHDFSGDLISGVGSFGSGADNEVWSYGEEAQKIMSNYILMRERLRPYIRSVMKDTHETGNPVMRPLFYEFSKDPESWKIDDEYLFGSDILVAPIYTENSYSRNVYLPAGESWKEVFTGKIYEGGQYITVDAPLDQIPLFERDGVELPILQ